MKLSGRSEEQIHLVQDYCKANLLWRKGDEKITYTHVLELDLSTIEPVIAGPKRPQDKILLKNLQPSFIDALDKNFGRKYFKPEKQIKTWLAEGGSQPLNESKPVPEEIHIDPKIENGSKSVEVTIGSERFTLSDGSVAIAAITSCTNTSNPFLMIGAGLIAKKREKEA